MTGNTAPVIVEYGKRTLDAQGMLQVAAGFLERTEETNSDNVKQTYAQLSVAATELAKVMFMMSNVQLDLGPNLFGDLERDRF